MNKAVTPFVFLYDGISVYISLAQPKETCWCYTVCLQVFMDVKTLFALVLLSDHLSDFMKCSRNGKYLYMLTIIPTAMFLFGIGPVVLD